MSGARKPILIVIAGPKISSQDRTFYDILPLLFYKPRKKTGVYYLRQNSPAV